MAKTKTTDFLVKDIRTGETKTLKIANKVEQLYITVDFTERKRGANNGAKV